MANPTVRAARRSLDQALTDSHYAHTILPKSLIRPRAMIYQAEELIAEAWKELGRGTASVRRAQRRRVSGVSKRENQHFSYRKGE